MEIHGKYAIEEVIEKNYDKIVEGTVCFRLYSSIWGEDILKELLEEI